jgi:hypothetical protein
MRLMPTSRRLRQDERQRSHPDLDSVRDVMNRSAKSASDPEALMVRSGRSPRLEPRGRHALTFPRLSPNTAPSWFETALKGLLTMRELGALAMEHLNPMEQLNRPSKSRRRRGLDRVASLAMTVGGICDRECRRFFPGSEGTN